MYNSKMSAKVTFAITIFFFALLGVLMVTASPLLNWFFGPMREKVVKTVLITFYVCCPSAIAALSCILKLTKNIFSEQIFVIQNVFCLRLLSWNCAFVALACLVAGWFYIPFLIFSLGAAFMCLILRVLKNVMEKATEIKNENELTI